MPEGPWASKPLHLFLKPRCRRASFSSCLPRPSAMMLKEGMRSLSSVRGVRATPRHRHGRGHVLAAPCTGCGDVGEREELEPPEAPAQRLDDRGRSAIGLVDPRRKSPPNLSAITRLRLMRRQRTPRSGWPPRSSRTGSAAALTSGPLRPYQTGAQAPTKSLAIHAADLRRRAAIRPGPQSRTEASGSG